MLTRVKCSRCGKVLFVPDDGVRGARCRACLPAPPAFQAITEARSTASTAPEPEQRIASNPTQPSTVAISADPQLLTETELPRRTADLRTLEKTWRDVHCGLGWVQTGILISLAGGIVHLLVFLAFGVIVETKGQPQDSSLGPGLGVVIVFVSTVAASSALCWGRLLCVRVSPVMGGRLRSLAAMATVTTFLALVVWIASWLVMSTTLDTVGQTPDYWLQVLALVVPLVVALVAEGFFICFLRETGRFLQNPKLVVDVHQFLVLTGCLIVVGIGMALLFGCVRALTLSRARSLASGSDLAELVMLLTPLVVLGIVIWISFAYVGLVGNARDAVLSPLRYDLRK